jgi:hypothetical protein
MSRALIVGLLAVVTVASGCMGTAVSQGFATVTGASPRFFEVREIAGGATALDRYQSVAVQAFDASPMLGVIPPDAVAETQAAALRRLVETRMFSAVGPAAGAKPSLVIRGAFVDYDSGGSAARAVGFGVNPFLTARIELVDGETGQVIGIVMVSGTVKSALRTGTKELADGVAKAIKGLVERHHTKPREEAKGR